MYEWTANSRKKLLAYLMRVFNFIGTSSRIQDQNKQKTRYNPPFSECFTTGFYCQKKDRLHLQAPVRYNPLPSAHRQWPRTRSYSWEGPCADTQCQQCRLL